jgi:hypothetical protein
MTPKSFRIRALFSLLLAAITFGAHAQSNDSANIAATDVFIAGSSLALEDVSATTGINIPVSIQTSFGGLKNEQAPRVPELSAVGDLTGPGLANPIELRVDPGKAFAIPGLQAEGTYLLQNVRLMRGTTFVQSAVPSTAAITVADVLKTKVSVRQLTAAELRARGIQIDARNFDVFEYTLSFFVGNKEVLVPFPVIVDKRTHEVRPITKENPYNIPGFKGPEPPPRWGPPRVTPMEIIEDGGLPGGPPEDDPGPKPAPRPSIPAAIIIPNSLGVLHEFFAVALNVANNAPAGSSIRLDSVTATMKNPPELRVADTKPRVSFGRPLPLVDPNTGTTILVAQGTAEAGWTLEGLKTGTHTFTIEVNATYKQSATSDPIALRGSVQQTIVVHDPRFNVTFSHPDVIRAGLTYSTFTFVTNMTSSIQTIRLKTGQELPACSSAGGASVCRLDDDIASVPICNSNGAVDVCRPSDDLQSQEVTLKPGATRTLVYKLRSSLTGNIFATAGTVEGDVVHVAVQLHMGVSTSGIPLSPATLVMPYYAQYLEERFVSDSLQLLGLGYSLATAPLNQITAKLPRVITTDVFHRAVDISRAGQRIFIGEDKRDTLANLTLDLLGNGDGNKLVEWDELRRREYSGRVAGAALGRQIEAASLKTSSDFDSLLSRFGQTTAHRAPYLVAVTHGAAIAGNNRPYALSVRGVTTDAKLSLPNEFATEDSLGVRSVEFGDLTSLNTVDKAQTGEMATVGIWNENFELTVNPAAGSSFTLDVLYPSTVASRIRHAVVSVTNASGKPLKAILDRTSGAVTLLEEGGSVSYSANATEILPAPLAIIAAHQDMHLDGDGHKVAVLFNRPVDATADYKDKFTGKVVFNQGSISYTGPRGVDAAALQDDERTLLLTFDHSLSKNATYSMTVKPITDPLSHVDVSFTDVVPIIENDRPAGIIYGRVLRGDNTPVPNAQVVLTSSSEQYDISSSVKADFLFEYVLRDVANNVNGAYRLRAIDENAKTTYVDGTVRLTAVVETVNLVFLGRGSAEGRVTYDNGQVVANARVVVGSTLFGQFRTGTTDADGRYRVTDLPVGPLTFSAVDAAGNTSFAASEIRSAGEIVTQDISIYRQPFPGTGTIRGIVLRSDTSAPVPNAHVGVYTQGYGLTDGYTGADGRFEFDKVTTGLVTTLASEWSVSRKAVGIDFELGNDQVKDLTLTLEVNPSEPLANLEGDVEEEDALIPGTYHKVPGALVQIDKAQVVTADSAGHFVYNSLPLSFGGRTIKAYNPASKRTAASDVPTLDASHAAYVRIGIRASDAYGSGTVRIRLLDAAGQPVSNYRVFEPGYPITPLTPIGDGRYELRNVGVGHHIDVWATPTENSRPTYGEQVAHGSGGVAFNGQTSLTVIRLPGQGKLRVRLLTDIVSIGDVNIQYPVWDDAEQAMRPTTISQSTKDPATGAASFAVFDKVPVGNTFVYAALANFGYDSTTLQLVYDGQIIDYDLHARKLASISGVVYAIDGQTPMPGVPVRISDGAQNQGPQPAALDGSFKFGNIAAGNGFTVTAETTVNGIYRVGRADGTAPGNGGPLNNVAVTMKQQGTVEGWVVYSGYKVFNPGDPSKNVVDDTPNDPSDNAKVPLAQFYLRELSYPYRSFGKETAPLTADINGHFLISNVFAGPVRLTGWSQQNQDLRGDGGTTVLQEGSTAPVYAAIGTAGFGPVVVTVVDPNNQNQPVENAEVALTGPPFGAVFDFGTTDANGTIRFDQVPARSGYGVEAFSKRVGKSGRTPGFSVQSVSGASVLVRLEFSGSVNGTLSDPEAGGAGVPGIPVVLATNTYQQQTSTAVNGSFFIGGVHEGPFVLDAMNETSRRRAHKAGAVSAADPNPTVNMELERTSPLFVKVFYPNDNGSQSNVEVPLSDIHVKQRCRAVEGGEICEYTRDLQGKSVTFTSLFASDQYVVTAHEIGGDQRSIGGVGTFPVGSTAANPFNLTLPAFGTVEVTVKQPGAGGVLGPAAGARVYVRGVSINTDTNGLAVAHGIPLGDLSVGAVSFDGTFSAYSPTVNLGSQTVPLQVSLDLGAYAGVSGVVFAETGGPSVATRVVAGFPGRLATVYTDSTGAYKFQGIPVSTSGPTGVGLTYYGPDDTTVGFTQSASLTSSNASQIVKLPDATLDATPPTVLGFKPDDNSLNVSPDSNIVITFSESIAAGTIHNGNFVLSPTDGTPNVSVGFSRAIDPVTKACTITMIAPPSSDPSQRFPLKSNMLYKVLLTGGITDERGHPLAQRGFSFTTADYVAPKVTQIEPATTAPLSAATTFLVHFNKPLAAQLFDANHNVAAPLEVHLYKLSGAHGSNVSELAGSAYGDLTNKVVSFAPTASLEEKSYYRLALFGVRDTLGNVADPISYDYFSFDKTAPFITFDAPVPAGTPVISGVRYTLKAVLLDGSATGAVATDVARVDFFRLDGATKTLLTSLTKPPYEYAFVPPSVTTSGTTMAFHVEGYDTSFNNATPAEISFDVAPNLPPQNVKLTLSTPDPIYAGSHVSVTPTLTDEGVLVTLQAQLTGTNADGTSFIGTRVDGQANRAKSSDPWTFSPAAFDIVLPSTLKEGSTASISLTATDGVNPVVTGTPATFTIAADSNNPTVTSLTVSPASPYHLNDRYTITAVVKDLETGVSDVTFTYDGISTNMKVGDAGVTPGAEPGTYRFVTPQITVPAKNDDTRIAIVVTARDRRGNQATGATEVTYIGVHDASLPRGAWVSPLANAAWPSERTSFATTLRVWAKDDQAITGVKFNVPGIADPVVATAAGNDVYSAQVTVTTPAAGNAFTVTALVSDADPAHTQTIAIPITLVKIDTVFGPNFTQAITTANDPLLNKNVLVQGPDTHLVMHVPFTFRNLIVVDGGSVETLSSTTSTERKLDVTVTDTLYVDATSSINVSGRGYLGGWAANPDSSGTRNDDSRGRTVGNTNSGGPTTGASASYAGTGAEYGGTTNRVYGSISAPFTLGTGGAGAPTCCSAGGAGGGAAMITGGSGSSALGRIIVAGTVVADGNPGQSAGSGGSIRIAGKLVSLGRNARVTANGADENGAGNASRGSGGGRVSVTASEQLDVDDALPQLQARGGRNLSGEGNTFLDGGAGTVFVRRPGQQNGELAISALDERVTSTTHQTRPTILGYAASGNSTSLTANTLTDSSRTFVSDVIGEELILGGDGTKSYTITAVSADGHTLTTDATDGSLLLAPGVSNGVVAYAGVLTFDAVRVTGRALARFDDSINIGGVLDSTSKATVTAPAVMLVRTDVPSVTTFTTKPADGGSLIRAGSFTTTYSATSAAGIGSASLAFSPIATPFIDAFNDYAMPASKTDRAIAVPFDAPLGAATLVLTVTDRAGRSFTAPAVHLTVNDNDEPVVDRFDVTPSNLQMYAGKTISIDAAGHDDIAVTSLTLATSVGTLTSQPPVPSADGKSVSRAFSVAVPVTVKGDTHVDLTLSASDGFPSRLVTPRLKTVVITRDPNPPAINVTSPIANQTFLVSSTVTIPVRATITDAEVAVDPATIFVSLAGGTPVAMVADPSTPNGWKADLPVPSVDGSQAVTKSIVVSAKDYEGNAATTAPGFDINIQPVFDPNGPLVAWLCPAAGGGALYPSGYAATVRVSAAGASADNGITSVNFYIGESTTPIAATLANGAYQAGLTLPSVADGTAVQLKVVATSIRGNTTTVTNTVTIVTGSTINGDTSVSSINTTYDNKTVIVTGGKLTLDGPHTFTRLVVLDGATVTHPRITSVTTGLNLTVTGATFVSCGGAIDTTGLGYDLGQTYPGATASTTPSAGSHIGRGGNNSGTSGSTFGSIYRPQEAGAGASHEGYPTGGGGVVRLNTGSLALDGAIHASGMPAMAAAGGAIWITAGKLSGSGSMDADGSSGGWAAGGGGAIAVEYTDASSTLVAMRATSSNSQGGNLGAPGSILVKGPANTFGALTVDNRGMGGSMPTDLPSLGKGLALNGTTGATLVTDRPINIPAYFVGHWVEVTAADGTLKGTWKIASISAKTATLAPNGSETISIAAGDGWQGVYRFDSISAPTGAKIIGNDPIRVGGSGNFALNGPTGAYTLDLSSPVSGVDVTIGGNVLLNGAVTATSSITIKPGQVAASSVTAPAVRVTSGASLTNSSTSPAAPLTVNASGTLTIEANGAIDLTGRGYPAWVTYPGATIPGNGSGGSHIGIGGLWDAPTASTFGSVYRPQEAGGGGDYNGGPQYGQPGGGVVRINAGAIALDGAIRAEGRALESESRGGAGGSIWITTNAMSGAGTVSANGAHANYGSGGGGAIALEYTTGTSVPWLLTAKAGTSNWGNARVGGAGTVYVRGPQSTYGDVTIDNGGSVSQATSLPSLGRGLALSGSTGATLVTDRTVDIPAYFVGHWIEIATPSGTLKGTWKVAAINAKSVTLAPNGSESISIAAGDGWQGVYRFDNLKNPTGAKIAGNDPIRIGVNGNVVINGPTGPSSLELPYAISGTDVTINGNVVLGSAITATSSVTINGGTTTATAVTSPSLHVTGTGTLTNPADAAGTPLNVNVSGTLTIDAGGAIDLTGHGYQAWVTYPGATIPGNGSGGSHIGVGGLWDPATASTFGSVYRPQEAGGGGDYNGGSQFGQPGGGVLRINAGTIALAGAIRSEGKAFDSEARGGAGGSIWITTNAMSGAGTVSANGAHANYGSGGGGAIAVEYTTGTSVPWTLTAKAGTSNWGNAKVGGAGTVYVRGPQSTYGGVTIDNAGIVGAGTTLPSLGRGLAANGSTGATLVTDRTVDIPAYFIGHWVEITAPDGTLKGTWKVATINARTATLAPNGSESISIAAGDGWQGVYRFDSFNSPTGGKITSIDPLRIGFNGTTVITGPAGALTLDLGSSIAGNDVTINGNVNFTGTIAATTSVTINNGLTSATALTSPTLHVTGTGTLSNPVNAVAAQFNINVSGAITIDAGGAIDVTGHGYPQWATYPGATTPGNGSGGSHLGVGGLWDAPTASAFGSVYRPQEAGGGGDYNGGPQYGQPGGGVLRINAGSIALAGAIRSEGKAFDSESRGGAGGSIWITTASVSGAGTVSANGSHANYGSGGGGAIALEYTTGTMPWTLTAKAGTSNWGNAKVGGAGTVYVRGPQSTYGDLTVDNSNFPLTQLTELQPLGIGVAKSGSTGATLVTDRATDIPAYFAGNWVNVSDANGVAKGSWRIATITNKTVTLAPNGSETINIQAGDRWRGSYKFDHLTLRNASFRTADLVELGSPLSSTASTYLFGNVAPPTADPSKMSIQPTATGVSVVGTAGAVTDPDQPIFITLTNTTSGSSFTGTAAADGSFAIGVQGNAGESITVKARDGHVYPLESTPVVVGTLASSTPTATQINRTDWTSDAQFQPRTIALEGTTLALASRIDGNTGQSDKVVILDISDPVRPSLKRVISTGSRVLDIKIVNNTLFVANNAFSTFDLSDPNSTQKYAGDPNGSDYSLVVAGGYAFTGEVDWNNDGRINVYDVSNPAAPRLLGQQAPTGVGNLAFNDLLTYGNDYLIGISAWGGGRDVVVIDRRNVNAMVKVGELQVPSFDAFHGTISGTNLYLFSDSKAEMVVVDLSNPKAPVESGRLALTAGAWSGVAVAGDMLVADATGGLVVTTTDPAHLQVTGSVTIPGKACDVVVQSGYAYVAHDNGLAIVPVGTAPVVNTNRITLALSGTSVLVAGASRAVTGGSPTVTIVDTATNATVASLPVNADGSFNASLPASAGDPITLTATNGRTNGPVSLGNVPFGSSFTTLPIVNPNGDGNWRARIVRTEGDNLVVASFPAESGVSDKILLYDISNPSTPALKRVIPTVSRVLNVQIVNGWAYVAGDRFGTVDLNNPNSTINLTGDPNGVDYGMAISGGYAFTAEADWFLDGRINIYDVSNPAQPRFIAQTGGMIGNHSYSDLLSYGNDYLVGVSGYGSGIDVVVIDRRNVNNLVKIGQLSIPNMLSQKAKISGTKLYIGGWDGGSAIVDLANPAAPVLVTSLVNTPISRGVDLAGSTFAVANGAQVAFYDVSADTLRSIGTQPVNGVAWDVAYGRGALYVAADTQLIVLNDVSAPPVIDARRITVGASSGTMATVTGSAAAISGQAPFTAQLKDVNSGATLGVTVAANGGFSASVPAAPGDTLTLKVTDANGRVAGPLTIGTMPFGTAVTMVPIVNPNGDGNFRARIVRTEGNNLVVASFPAESGVSDKILLYDISNPSSPLLKRVIPTVNRVLNVQLVNGWAYVTGDRFATIDLNNPSSTVNLTGDPNGVDYGLAVGGGYAFTAEADWFLDGRINIYDVSNPAQPRFVRQTGGIISNHSYSDLLVYGTDYLVGISGYGSGIDVTLIDRRNVNNLFKVGQLSIPNMLSQKARLSGTKLYIAGWDGGSAIVDLANPAAPALVTSLIGTPISRGLDLAGSTLAVANGGQGVAFYDVSADTLRSIGNQPTGGVAWDAAFNGANLYVANDQGLVVIQNVTAPPQIDTRQISLATTGSSAIVHGNASAITGLGTLSIDVKDAATSAVITVTVNANGSFDATLPATAGDTVTIKATDGSGRTAGPVVVGAVPFGSSTTVIPIVAANGDANWRTRMVRTEGNNLVLTSFGAENVGTCDKVVIYDISNPAVAPVFKRALATEGGINDVKVVGGWAYVAANRFGTIDLSDPNATFNRAPDLNGSDYGIAISGGYAFTGEVSWFDDGRLNIYDITDPATPRFVRQTPSLVSGNNGHFYSDLLPYGTNYLIGIARTNALPTDLVVLDRRDINNIFRVGQVSLGNNSGFHAKIVGSKVYVGGWEGGETIVDVSNPASPAIVATANTSMARGGDIAGSVLALPNGSQGVAFYDVANDTLRSLGVHQTGGTAWDASFSGGNLYVANDQGLVVIQNVATPPSIHLSLISMTPSNGTSATVSGGAHAIGGSGALTIAVKNVTTGAVISGVAVNADGSFTTSITAKSGEPLTISATDGASRTSTRSIGPVPFFTVVKEYRATRDDDNGMTATHLITDGTNTVATTSTNAGFVNGADKSLMLLSGSTTATQFTAGIGTINDAVLKGTWAYFAGERLTTVDLSATPLTRYGTADPNGRDMSVAVMGNYAITGEGNWFDDARLNIYDVTNPAAPTLLRQQSFGNGGTDYYSLLPLGSQYLIGLSSNQPGSAGDVAVFDVSNINNINRVKVIDIPNFSGNYGVISGNWLYVVGYFNTTSYVAIVDLTTPSNPVLVSTIATLGTARNVAVSGTNEIVVADAGGPGLTFIDVTDKVHPAILGSQQVNGNAKDVKAVGKTLYVATETRLITLQRP